MMVSFKKRLGHDIEYYRFFRTRNNVHVNDLFEARALLFDLFHLRYITICFFDFPLKFIE